MWSDVIIVVTVGMAGRRQAGKIYALKRLPLHRRKRRKGLQTVFAK